MKEVITIEDILKRMGSISQSEKQRILSAYSYAVEKHAGQVRRNGDDYMVHPLTVAFILTDLNVDVATIEAALIHEVMNRCGVSKEELTTTFGEEIASIVDSVSKMNRLELADQSESSAIYLRKVLVGLAEDVRVLFLKLADRIHNLRTADALPREKQIQKAQETMSVLVPIARRLGMNSIYSELEDLSLRYLKPEVYQDILNRLNATYEELKDVLNEMQDSIRNILIENGIHFHMKSRVKSVYSIYHKLNSGKNWSNIYDILAMRIITDQVSDCYTILGLIHAKYRPIPGRFKDYIAMPKENMYQSLHTGIFGIDGHRFEVQIRTQEMDEIAEKGIASHWSYKEQGAHKIHNLMEQKLEVFRNAISAGAEESDTEFANYVKQDLLNDFIYVFTPKGDVVELPKGSTPVDFAYRIHSDIGDHLVGASVNDAIVPLNYELHDDDIVRVKTSNSSTPSKEWLNFVQTGHARNKIKAYFSKQDRDFYIAKGKEIFEKEIRKKKLSFDAVLSAENVKKICQTLKCKDMSEVYLAIGSLRYTALSILGILLEDEKDVEDILIEKIGRFEQKTRENFKNEIIVAGSGDILVNLAKCCKPVYGDEILGYVTKGEGVSVHRSDCVNVKNKNDRFLSVSWNAENDQMYFTDIVVETITSKNYLSDLIAKATEKNIFIDSVRTKENDSSFFFDMTVRVRNLNELESLFTALQNLKFVKGVRRK